MEATVCKIHRPQWHGETLHRLGHEMELGWYWLGCGLQLLRSFRYRRRKRIFGAQWAYCRGFRTARPHVDGAELWPWQRAVSDCVLSRHESLVLGDHALGQERQRIYSDLRHDDL